MINFIKSRDKEYYKKQFEIRFEEILNISNEKKPSEFATILIDEIEKQYKNEIKESYKPEDYIKKEKIRLRAEIEYLKSQDFSVLSKNMSGLYSIIASLLIAAIGFLLTSAKSMVDFAVQNKIEQLKDSNIANINEAYSILQNIYSDYNIGNIDMIGKVLTAGILIIGSFFLYLTINEIKDRKYNNRKKYFEGICLDVLENIEV